MELSLKAAPRAVGVEVPRVHDVGTILKDHASRFPDELRSDIDGLAAISRRLARERELSFYGDEQAGAAPCMALCLPAGTCWIRPATSTARQTWPSETAGRDFAVKTSLNPARMLGIPTKGHLAVGADADVTVVDLEAGRATWSVAGGRVVLAAGRVEGLGGILMVTPQGEAAAKAALQSYSVIHREGWG